MSTPAIRFSPLSRYSVALACLVAMACGTSEAVVSRDAGGDASADMGRDAPREMEPDVPALDALAMDDAAAGDPPFRFLEERAGVCPLADALCDAIWPTEGTVTEWTSEERFGEVTRERTAWLYRPPDAGDAPLPLVVYLHGGTGNGAGLMALPFDELARGESLFWRQGDAACRFTYLDGFRDPEGARCTAPVRSYRSTEPFALLFPEGIPSVTSGADLARHWEDGRSPSPGQGTLEETRDDVGFLAHLIAESATRGDLDPSRVYVAGASNGGMMTQRLACALGEPGREALAQVSAVVISVAALPANLYDGTDGRPRCPRSGIEPPAMYFQKGRGFPTPDCARFPCDAPVADGDGRMPFGAPGSMHRVFSPDGGFVRSFEDTRDLFDGALASAFGADGPAVLDAIGLFTERSIRSYAGGRLELRVLVTEGGAHATGGARAEFASPGRQWAFLSRFHRVDGRVEARRQGSSVRGTF